MAFPLTYTTSLHPTLAATAQLFALLNMLYQTPMAYFNNTDDAYFYPTSDELDVYPFANQTPPTGDVNLETPGAFADGWSQGGQPYNAVGQSASLWAEASSESMSSAAPYPTPALEYGQSPFPGHYWPITAPYTQPYGPGTSRDYPFASTAVTEAPTMVPTSSSTPFDHWRTNDSGLSTGTFYSNVQRTHQPGTGPTRTDLMSTWRFQPYGVSHIRLNERANAEAGPSTQPLPPITYVAPPITYPSGGTSEATADAETNNSTTEEDTAPTTKRPRGTGEPRDWRIRYQRDMRKLCIWAKWWKNLPKLPSREEAFGIALEVIETIRVQVYPEPQLRKGNGKRTAVGKKAPDTEHKRRKGTRGLNEELSQYYPLPVNRKEWGCPELLLKVLEDVLNLPGPCVKPST